MIGGMGVFRRRLSEGEYVVLSTRTHWKALVIPALVLVVTCGLAGYCLAILPSGAAHDPLLWTVIAVGGLVILWLVVRPFLSWFAATFTVTNFRLISRHGVLRRVGRDIPLSRINDVSYERGLWDRLLGCGTLVVSDASERGRSVLHDVPDVKRLRQTIADLLFGAESGDGPDETGVRRRRGTR